MPPPKKTSGSQKNAAPPPAPAPAPAPSKSGKGKGSGADSGRGTPSSGGEQGQQDAGSTRPTVRQVIGGQLSYTGNLPTEILSKYCEEKKWHFPPSYNTVRYLDEFLGSVTLQRNNPKTQQVEQVEFTPPREMKKVTGEMFKLHQKSHLEAKHLLATYALNRVANMINVDFGLPKGYKAIWDIFEHNRKHDLKSGKGWMYEADPFRVQRERNALKEKLERERSARVEAQASGVSMRRPGGGDWNERMKGWQNVPIAEMGKDMRMQVEDLVRKYHNWNPNGVDMSKEARRRVVEELMNLGFRKSHVEEACDWAADREECLGE